MTRCLTAALVAVPLMTAAAPAQAAHPHALWHVVHDLCEPDRRLLGLSAPCLAVDLAAGDAVVPDPRAPLHLLLVPLRRLTGIEDPALLAPDAPNYFRRAWAARRLLARRLGAAPPRTSVAMAVNAIPGRSQDQLHIHLSCVRPDVAAELGRLEPALSDRWSTVRLAGHAWRARALAGEDLDAADPFVLLAQSSPTIAAHMGRQTLVAVGANLHDGPGFYLLSRSVDPATGYEGHGEFLLDETCRAERPRSDPG